MLFSPFFICKCFHRVLNLPRQSFVLKRDFLRLWNLLSLKFACWPRGWKGWKWNRGEFFPVYNIHWQSEKKMLIISWREKKICYHMDSHTLWRNRIQSLLTLRQLIFTSYSSMVSRQHCSIILSQVYSFFYSCWWLTSV